MSKVRTRPMERPAIFEKGPRSSMAVPYTANTRKKVRMASMITAFALVIPPACATVGDPRNDGFQRLSGTAARSSSAPNVAPASWATM
jgi:hypothetical protein